jgi:hypothetical protein
MYDVQIDVKIITLVSYTDPLQRPKNRKHVDKTVNTSTVSRLKH